MYRVKKLFIYFIAVFVLFFTQGCGGDNIQKEINAGNPFTVIFDRLDVDLGNITPNSRFEVQFKDGKFEATGIPKGQTSPQTVAYALSQSGINESSCPKCISIWGAIFEYDEDNNIFKDKKIVGQIVLKKK